MVETVLLVAGGTGGHLFPALALRDALIRRGWRVHVATDPRVSAYIENVPDADRHVVRSATFGGGNPAAAARSLATLLAGLAESRRLLRRIRPRAVVGFGGYPTVPPLVAARLAGLPIVVHEQNAVLGRANRLIVRLGAHLATGFENPKGGERAKARTQVGNPVRIAVRDLAGGGYREPGSAGLFRLLVFGGSQGARAFSEIVPAAVAALSEAARGRLAVVQQCRPEDIEPVREAYARLGVPAELAPFFADMPRRLADAHLVISRAGASTVAEIAAMGRPAILVPYPHALDHDQAANAAALAKGGGAWLVEEAALTPAALALRLEELMGQPELLAAAARCAAAEGRTDAAERLADLLERMAKAAHGERTT